MKKKSKNGMIKNTKNLFKIKKESKAIKDKIISDIRHFLELEKWRLLQANKSW